MGKLFSRRIINKGAATNGNLFVIVFLVVIVSIGILLVGGQIPANRAQNTGSQVVIITPVAEKPKADLQLYTFLGVTVTPTPIPTTAPPAAAPLQGDRCQGNQYNDEPEILVGSDPGPAGVVHAGGQIRVWVTDEGAPYISANEVVDPATGQITTPGNRAELDGRGSNFYSWEPALYITKLTGTNPSGPFSGDAENGGKPYFPLIVKGQYNTHNNGKGSGLQGPPIDSDWTNFQNGPNGKSGLIDFTDEYIWDVNTLGLAPGSYHVEFVIHDGDDNLGIDCLTIQI